MVSDGSQQAGQFGSYCARLCYGSPNDVADLLHNAGAKIASCQSRVYSRTTTYNEMQDKKHEILVWLPSPMGDAILCTPALRAIRRHFKSARISFFARPAVREVLSPSSFNDIWLEQRSNNPFAIAKMFREREFMRAVLFKNSFASALAVFLGKIHSRVGYARECRSLFLTDKLYPPKLHSGKFKPISMMDYYLAIASWLGADTADRNLELSVDPQVEQQVQNKLPEVIAEKTIGHHKINRQLFLI